MIKSYLITIAVILVVICVALCVIPVYAINDPDSPLEVNAVYAYENTEGAGDLGVLVDINIEYTTTPDETVTEAYLVIFVDTDGVTQLKSVAPYTFTASGYGRNMAWIHFTPAEVTTYGLDSANIALYEIWLVGNPTLAWTGDPPKTIANIDDWQTITDPSTLIALRVLYYADVLELAWSLDLIEITSLGNRLTTLGADCFENIITNLRDIAPACFSAGTTEPIYEDIDYSTTCNATMTNGTGIVTGSPINMGDGTTTVTVTGAGTFTIELMQGTVGTIEDNGGAVVGSPVDLVAGTNTVTVNIGDEGTLDVTLELVNTETSIWALTIGTAFDLTDVATAFGMSRGVFSGLIWLVVTIIICAAANRVTDASDQTNVSSSKITMLLFDVCIVGGAVLGLIPLLPAVLLFISFGAFTGYIIFFRGANI